MAGVSLSINAGEIKAWSQLVVTNFPLRETALWLQESPPPLQSKGSDQKPCVLCGSAGGRGDVFSWNFYEYPEKYTQKWLESQGEFRVRRASADGEQWGANAYQNW
jgi:hypothetical protein